MKQIALIGECMIELNGKAFEEMYQTFGGDTLNSAVYLSRVADKGADIHYVTVMGTDPISEGIVSRWQQEGINTDMVLRDAGRQPGLYLIQLDERGERTFLYWRNQSAARFLLQHAEFNKVAITLEKMDVVYLSGISLAILPSSDRKKLLSLLNSLASQGVKIAFDSNFRPALWRKGELWSGVKHFYSQILSICDIALLTFDDEQEIWGDSSSEEALNRLSTSGVSKVVLKLGDKGCIYRDFAEEESIESPAVHVQEVVDTTSAGDSFNAGFLSGYLQGLSPQECCVRGNELAGIVIQHKGAIVPLSATETLSNTFKQKY
ncbi:sugar kinase [Vibrio atypicus]|uniref:sugar kinase n=1 Tax=Vibrio atypicus TaxID=558271 RepID=UPI003735A67F